MPTIKLPTLYAIKKNGGILDKWSKANGITVLSFVYSEQVNLQEIINAEFKTVKFRDCYVFDVQACKGNDDDWAYGGCPMKAPKGLMRHSNKAGNLVKDINRIMKVKYELTYGGVVDAIEPEHIKQVQIPLLNNQIVQKKINDLALEANAKRYEAYKLEQEALHILDNEVIFAK